MSARRPIPATVLTGFLGAGKTTLLRRILTEDHGLRIAVIENELAGENIDAEILADAASETIVRMTNGCLCCTIRDDLRRTLEDLHARRQRGEIAFDRVVIETTGLADPGPVAQTFFIDPGAAKSFRLDGIVTLVDAKHAPQQLEAHAEARRQVGFADRIVINKVDLTETAALDALAGRLAAINARAPQSRTRFGDVRIAEVFDVRGFDLTDAFDTPSAGGFWCLAEDAPRNSAASKRDLAATRHTNDIKSFVFRTERPLHGPRFAQFMNAIIRSYGTRLLRYKGILNVAGEDRKIIFQGMHQLLNQGAGAIWPLNEPRRTSIVFIGIDLPEEMIVRTLRQCAV